jgi:class 3 adenylate cyclase/tetratricopeptide (TPR) repeat protein
MRCSTCGAENPDRAKFCEECASPFTRRCPTCDTENSPNANFCIECAKPLERAGGESQGTAAASSPIEAHKEIPDASLEGERKTVTMLFADITRSMELIEDLDPEEASAIVDPALKLMIDAVHHYDGYVAQPTGDGIFALFGAPVAHEDHPQRALFAALRIQAEVKRYAEKLHAEKGVNLQVRVGANVGKVVVRKIRTGKKQAVYTPIGHSTGVAARLEALAPPGSIAVTDAIRKLCEGYFKFTSLGPIQIKGVSEPVEVFEVTGLGALRTRFQRSAVRGFTPFVGRDEEMRMLLSRWELACEGEGQLVLISGEAGIGKSRLIRELRTSLAGTQRTWIQSDCSPYFQNTPFATLADLIQQDRSYLGGGETVEVKLQKLEQNLKQSGLKLAEAVPLIANLLNLPLPARYETLQLSPEEQRKRLLTTLMSWLFGLAQAQPTVLVVEDLQWADPSTLELQQLQAEQCATVPLLMLFTARPEFRAPWSMRAHHAQITLNRLNRLQARELVARVAGSGDLSKDVLDAVVERSSGVPLFAEELTRAVLESGAEAARAIPATLEDSLMARLDRLGPAKDAAQVAAVIGREFSYKLLQAISPMTEEELQSALAKLAGAELIYARGASPEANYQFKHALVQDTAYAALLKSRRRELHRRIANIMTERFPQTATEHPEVLARHWTGADELEKALTAWRSAGRSARKRRAFREAERAYQHALEVIDKLPESRERDDLELPIAIALAQLKQLTHGYAAAETKEAYARALTLVRRIGNVGQLSLQLIGTWAAAIDSGEYRSADVLSKELIELTEREGNPMNLAFAHMARIETHFFLGQLAEAEGRFVRGRAFFDEQVFKQFPGALGTALAFGGLTAFTTGRIDTAFTRISEAARAAQQTNNPYDLAYISFISGALKLLVGEAAEAVTAAREAINLSDEHGFPHIAAAARATLGAALANCGEAVQGVQLIEESLIAIARTETRMGVTLSLFYLAQAQALLGATESAFLSIERALEANPDEVVYRPEVFRLRGECRLRVGDRERAEQDFHEAVACAHGMGAKSFELRATTSLARLLAKQGRRDEARTMLAEIYNRFTEGFDTADLKDADALLEELSNSP